MKSVGPIGPTLFVPTSMRLSQSLGIAPIAALALLACAVGYAQAPPRFAASTDLVVLHMNVQDRRGKAVSGLPEDAFSVLEDGQPQPISFFTNEDVPVTVGLIVDNSTSMWSIRDRVIAGAVAFAEASRPGDEMFALAFNEDVRPALSADAPFTNDIGVLRRALTTAITARGRTALLDGVSDGLAYAAHGSHPRKVLVVISDGGDNASTATFRDVMMATEASNVVIYTIALVDPDDRDANPKMLRQLAQASGGEAFTPRDANEIRAVLEGIARDIREAYTVGYRPTRAPDGTFRHVQVVVSSPDHARLTVRTRGGYLAARSPARSDGDVH